MENNFFGGDCLVVSISDEQQLTNYNQKLIALREEKNSCPDRRHSRYIGEIINDIDDTEFRRKLLLEKMSVMRLPQNQFNNSQVHLGIGDNIGRDKIENNPPEKWHQKWWGKLILTIVGGLILAFLVYEIGWNR